MKVDIRNHRVNVVGKSVEAFAAEIGVSPDVIRNLELTGNRPRPENAIAVARYFDKAPDDLWPINDDPPPLDVGRVRKVSA
jgi:DNA-binding XRE family transcriptional regulator